MATYSEIRCRLAGDARAGGKALVTRQPPRLALLPALAILPWFSPWVLAATALATAVLVGLRIRRSTSRHRARPGDAEEPVRRSNPFEPPPSPAALHLATLARGRSEPIVPPVTPSEWRGSGAHAAGPD